jgi:hypothetical protein
MSVPTRARGVEEAEMRRESRNEEMLVETRE